MWPRAYVAPLGTLMVPVPAISRGNDDPGPVLERVFVPHVPGEVDIVPQIACIGVILGAGQAYSVHVFVLQWPYHVGHDGVLAGTHMPKVGSSHFEAYGIHTEDRVT